MMAEKKEGLEKLPGTLSRMENKPTDLSPRSCLLEKKKL
jgi:hypothetical protein